MAAADDPADGAQIAARAAAGLGETAELSWRIPASATLCYTAVRGKSSLIHSFEEFELDTELFELRRQGQRVPIEPQVFNVLQYLIEHADHVVSKD